MLAYDEATGETSTYTVTATWEHTDPVVTTVTLDGEELETTPEHPFYVPLRGWVPHQVTEKGYQAHGHDCNREPFGTSHVLISIGHTLFVCSLFHGYPEYRIDEELSIIRVL
jgi:hypothetical protein